MSTIRPDDRTTMRPDDPRLTAYALGELDDAEERAAVEELLQRSEEARRAADEMRTLARDLTAELAAEPAPVLDGARREAIRRAMGEARPANPEAARETAKAARQAAGRARQAARETPRSTTSRRLRLPAWTTLALAASLVAVLGTWWASRGGHVASSPAPSMRAMLPEERQIAPSETDAAREARGTVAREGNAGKSTPDASVMSPGVLLMSDPNVVAGQDLSGERTEALERPGYEATTGLPRRALGEAVQKLVDHRDAQDAPALSTRIRALGIGEPSQKVAKSKESFGGKRGGRRNLVSGLRRRRIHPDGAQGRPSLLLDGVAGGNPGAPAAAQPPVVAKAAGPAVAAKASAPAMPDGSGDVWRHEGRYTGPSDFTRPQVPGTESYAAIRENAFASPLREPLSTFSIDVDTGSYTNVRRFLHDGQLPPPDAVRLEEMINYFAYDYPPPGSDVPFSVAVETAACPWSPRHTLLRIGLQGRDASRDEPSARNLVFLVDVSGSMRSQDKLPLLRSSMELLLHELHPQDRVAIVSYAASTGVVLDSTPCTQRDAIRRAIRGLVAGGSTNGGAGIQMAYDLAAKHFIEGGTNRVILATDGDFNAGITDLGALQRLIEQKARGGVYLTVLAYGTGNLKDSTAEMLADRGNGNYAYIDSLDEARKVLVDGIDATLETIAKDVKIQVEFNPSRVGAYRLLGYENRALAAEDFNDDTKDAGEIGAGHQVTALYEIVPVGTDGMPGIDPLKYQRPADTRPIDLVPSPELATVKLRWKAPEGGASSKIEVAVLPGDDEPGETRPGDATSGVTRPGMTLPGPASLAEASEDFRFAAAVAAFGMLLRGSRYAGDASFESVARLAESGRGEDPRGYRAEFVRMVRAAGALAGGR